MYTRVAGTNARLSLRGFLQMAPRQLVERFGPPGPGSADRKVTGTYHFRDAHQRVIQIYDWKATTLYDARPEAGTLSVTDFWAADVPQAFSVAATARIDFAAFAQWLEAATFRTTWA
jgi:hypothetical protein